MHMERSLCRCDGVCARVRVNVDVSLLLGECCVPAGVYVVCVCACMHAYACVHHLCHIICVFLSESLSLIICVTSSVSHHPCHIVCVFLSESLSLSRVMQGEEKVLLGLPAAVTEDQQNESEYHSSDASPMSAHQRTEEEGARGAQEEEGGVREEEEEEEEEDEDDFSLVTDVSL